MKRFFATILTAIAVVAIVIPCAEAKGRKHRAKRQHKRTAVRHQRVREIPVVEDSVSQTDKVIIDWGDVVVVEKKQEKPAEVKEEEVDMKETNEIFKLVEQAPQFPGGDYALLKYVSSHINYPAAAQENNVQGRTVLQFVVEKNGKVGEVKIAKSAGDTSLDREAIRVVKTLPAFTPGRQGGKVVRVWYTLPVNFKLKPTDAIDSSSDYNYSGYGDNNDYEGSDDRNWPTIKKDEVILDVKPMVMKEKEVSKEYMEEEKQRRDNEIFRSVEQSPTFPGGEAALVKYVNSHISYPAAAKENNVQGRTVLQFVIEKNGKVGEVKIAKSSGDASLDREAIRVVKTLPAFTPGRQGGKVVRVWYTMPVAFKLPK